MELKFSSKAFAALNPFELYAYLQLRSEVFVVEQNCVYQDLDDKDQQALHIFVHHHDKLVACARIVPAALAYPEISIGRVIVAFALRKLTSFLGRKKSCCRHKHTCKIFIKSTTLYPKELPI
jgi:ElaA protein